MPSKIIATCFALGCFACAMVVGVLAGNSANTIIMRAMFVMFPAWIVGRVVGGIAERVIIEHIDQYKRANPIPDDHQALVDASRELIAEPVVEEDMPPQRRAA